MLSPKEIGEKTFDKTFGIGYRMDDVDRYLEQIAASMVESIEIKEQLEKKLEVLAEKLTEYREDEESLRTALLGAQKLGDSVIRESKTKAEIIMRDATIKAEAMVNNAKRQIDREQESLNQLKKEVASFKNRLLTLYKQHLELISALPDDDAVPPVPQPVEAPIPETPMESNEVPASEASPVPQPGFLDEDAFDDLPPEEPDLREDDPSIEASTDTSRFGDLRFGENFKIKRDPAAPRFKK